MICKALCTLHIIDNSTVNFLRPLSSVGVSCKWQPTVSDCDHVKQWLIINLLCCYLLFDSHVHCMNYDTGSIGKFVGENMALFICYMTFCVPVHLNSPQKHQEILLDILWPCSLQQPTEKPALFHLTFCVYIPLNCPQKNQHNFLDILWSCSLEQPTEKLTYFAWHCVVMLLEPPTDKPTYFTWHFVFVFTWTAHRKTNIISLTFCGCVHLNSQQRNWHILLDIVWSCYLNHLQINQHISPDILCLYSLELPTEKTTYFT